MEVVNVNQNIMMKTIIQLVWPVIIHAIYVLVLQPLIVSVVLQQRLELIMLN